MQQHAHNGPRPEEASGTAARLYRAVQAMDFWRLLGLVGVGTIVFGLTFAAVFGAMRHDGGRLVPSPAQTGDRAMRPVVSAAPARRAGVNASAVISTGAPVAPRSAVIERVSASPGARYPVVARVKWTTAGKTGASYRIFRSASVAGPFELLGTVSGKSFDDTSGIPGQKYAYSVRPVDAQGRESSPSRTTGLVKALTLGDEPIPHRADGSGSLCASCHVPHVAETRHIFRETSSTAGELPLCYYCHDGSLASDTVKESFSRASGHMLEALPDTATTRDLTNACSGCHDPHPRAALRESLWRSRINTTTVSNVTGRNNTWCLACHNDSQDWYVQKYGTAYPNLATPTVDASGYPVTGVFPGPSVYTSTGANAHMGIPAASTPDTRVAGDCLYCHAAHRGPSRYDSLLSTFSPSTPGTVADDRVNGTYASACLTCHGGGAWEASGAVDIKQFATYSGADDSQYSGHRIKSSGASLPVNAPLPCYECHNPHGSSRGNKSLISDARGQNLDTKSSEAEVRHFCLTCHSTSDTYGWDSVAATYAVVTNSTLVEGLGRAGGVAGSGPDGGYNWLRLKAVAGAHAVSDTRSCYSCHGNSYAVGANNVHRPTPGVSAGGTGCYSCHTSYQVMDAFDGNNQSAYHHVLGTSETTYTGDATFTASTYPTGPETDVFCLSCHVDHDRFNSDNAANLRPDSATASPTVGVEFDYSTTSNTGVCTSCHATSLAKDTANQKDDGSSNTPRIAAGGGAGQFGASAHNYAATSVFKDSTTFEGNCVKCHNDEQPKEKQTSTNQFGPHFSAARRILSVFGAGVSDPQSEERCFGCHTGGTAGNDVYGAEPMGQAPRRTETEFSLTSKHPVVASGGNSVECENCHNPHTVSSVATVSDPANIYNSIGYSTTLEQATFCLRCHSGAGSLPAYQVNGTTFVPATVTIAAVDQPLMDKSANASRGHWNVNGSISSGEAKACADCHSKHGSRWEKLLGAYDAVNDTNTINGEPLTGNDKSVCFACHTSASAAWPAASRNASGYPTDGTFPGEATYTVTFNPSAHTGSMHTTSSAVWPGTTYAGGDCKNCHDVHGTANTFDALRTEDATGTQDVYHFSQNDFGLCFNCHDSGGPAIRNIAGYYPTASGGTAVQTGSTGFGHKTLSAGNLPAGSALPCYDCHNPHGSASPYGLMIETQAGSGTTITVGDASGEITMPASPALADAGLRNFCFTCHTTADTAAGWNGTAMAVVTAGKVEGIDRTTYSATGAHLRLPPVDGHNAANTQPCYQCHGSDYSGAATNNVHNPTAGVSSGAQACYGCHTTFNVMDRANTASRTASYHHVVGTSTADYTGDTAFAQASYPGTGTTVYCLSCHVDHDVFNGLKGANLRSSGATGSTTATNTDFVSGSGGICLSCHGVALAIDNVYQKSSPETNTPTMTAAAYAASRHNYEATSSFSGGSIFKANCVKCHNDEQAKDKQTSALRFGVHFSAERRILAQLGVPTLSDPMEEKLCYSCHSLSGNGYKSVSGLDWYGRASMSGTSQDIYTLMSGVATGHLVANYSGKHLSSSQDETRGYLSATKHVECADCHNVHASSASRHATGALATNLVSGALQGVSGAAVTTSSVNWTSPTAYAQVASSTYEYQICFKCHSGFNTSTQASGSATLITWGGTGAQAWTDAGLEFSTTNQSYHPVLAALPPTDPSTTWGSSQLPAAGMRAPWTRGRTMYCSDCHADSTAGSFGPHGSAVKWLLKGPNKAWPYTSAALNGTNGTANFRLISSSETNIDTSNGNFCRNCHVVATTNPHNANSNHNSAACVTCHIRVPHGGKVSRLINANGSATYPGNLPLRYTGSGTGSGPGTWIRRFTKQTPPYAVVTACDTGGAACTSKHPSGGGALENW